MSNSLSVPEEKLGYPVLTQVGDVVRPILFGCEGGCALTFLEGLAQPRRPSDPDGGFSRGPGLPGGTIPGDLLCAPPEVLEARGPARIPTSPVLSENGSQFGKGLPVGAWEQRGDRHGAG